MTVIQKSKIVPYTNAQMFYLVNDVEKYPEFIPWCTSSTIHHRDEHKVEASLCFTKGAIHKCFRTANTLSFNQSIVIQLVSGPFKSLSGAWYFDQLNEQSCKVRFNMEFEFKNKILSMLLGPLFNQVTSTLVDVFCKRAQVVFGKQS